MLLSLFEKSVGCYSHLPCIFKGHADVFGVFVVQSLSLVRLFATSWTLGFPVLHHLLSKLMSIESVMPSNHLILCRPLLLLPSIFPRTRVFSLELALCIMWPKYWSFSFSISHSNKYSELISFRIDSFDLLAVQGTLKILLQRCFPQFESVNSLALSLYIGLRISFLKWFSNILID